MSSSCREGHPLKQKDPTCRPFDLLDPIKTRTERTQICNNLAQERQTTWGGGRWIGDRDPDSSGCGPFHDQTICTKIGWNEEDLIPCCSGELNTSVRCNPDWCPGSNTCANSLRSYCMQNNGENILSPACQSICLNPSINSSTKTWCDIASLNFCDSPLNRSNIYCRCVNSTTPQLLRCVDANCGDPRSYRSSNIEKDIKLCEGSDICGIFLNFPNCQSNNDGCNIDIGDIQNRCGTTGPIDTNPVPRGPPEKPPSIPTTPPNEASKTINITTIIIIVVIIIIVIVIIIVIMNYES